MSTEPPLRIFSIQAEGLFDLFDHQVDLESDDRVTILHGPNGVGKTMLLRMVNDLPERKIRPVHADTLSALCIDTYRRFQD